MHRRPLLVAAALTLLLFGAVLLFPVPALSDPTGDALPASLRLTFPVLNILFAPLFDLWDGVTLLAMPRLHAFLLGAVVLGAIGSLAMSIEGRRVQWLPATRRLAWCVVGLGLFVLAGIRWHRPMAHLTGVPTDRWVVDLHSHTNASHDVKGWLQGGFDLDASRRWHARGGFDAFFVTDHNRMGGPAVAGRWAVDSGTPMACPGEELSLHRAHIVVLGNSDSIPRSRYADSSAGITRLMLESGTEWGGVTMASLPEYDDNHFEDLPGWIAAGLDGIEVSNPAPKANRQRTDRRDSVIALARGAGRWVAGVTDQHGMGATVQSWTLVQGTMSLTSAGTRLGPCGETLGALWTLGRSATQVVERHRLRNDSAWPRWTTVLAVVWEGWRAAGVWQVMSWLAWIWGIAVIAGLRPRKAVA